MGTWMNPTGKLSPSSLPNLKDAYRSNVAPSPSPILDIKFCYSTLTVPFNTDYVTATLVSGATVVSSQQATLRIETAASSNSSATVTSNLAIRYGPGQGVSAIVSALFNAQTSGSYQIIGLGSTNSTTSTPSYILGSTMKDGLFFGYTPSQTQFAIITVDNSSAPTIIPSTSWNVDKMDGTGPSGMVLSPVFWNSYKIQFQWLGFGAINFYILDRGTGQFVMVHQIQYTNANTIPSMANPTLQVLAQAANTTNTSVIELDVIAMGAYVEGSVNPALDSLQSTFASRTLSIAGTLLNFITLQNNPSFPNTGSAVANQVRVYMQSLSVTSTSTSGGTAQIFLYLNPTVGGSPSFSSVNSNSVVSFDTLGTTVTGGKLLFAFTVGAGGEIVVDLTPYTIYLNPSNTLVVAANVSTTSTPLVIAPSWGERF